jgi:hypothetical protein
MGQNIVASASAITLEDNCQRFCHHIDLVDHTLLSEREQ